MKKTTIFFAILFVLVACNGKKERANSEIRQIEVLNHEFLNATRLTQFAGNFVFVDTRDTVLLHLIDIATLNDIYKGFKIGRGPNEILGPFSIFKKSETEFWIHDIVNPRFFHFVIQNDSIKLINKINLANLRVMFPSYINDSTILAINMLDSNKGWIIEIDKDGNYTRAVVEYPKNSQSYPEHIFTESLQGILKVKPGGDYFAYCCRFTDILSIYSANGTLIKNFRTKDPFDPIMSVSHQNGSSNMAQNKNTRYAFVGMEVSKDYIFALYSGTTNGDRNPNYAKCIKVFDWAGNFIKELLIPYPAENICWSDYDNCLYMFIIKDKERKLARLKY